MTVFCVHPVERDLSAVAQWGAIRYIADRHIYADQLHDDGGLPRENQMKIDLAAADFDVYEDYFLLIGDQLQLVAFAAELTFKHGAFRVLRYDKKAEGYVPARIQT